MKDFRARIFAQDAIVLALALGRLTAAEAQKQLDDLWGKEALSRAAAYYR